MQASDSGVRKAMASRQSHHKSRWLICALLPARIKDPDEVIRPMATFVSQRGGEVVARLIQRRGIPVRANQEDPS